MSTEEARKLFVAGLPDSITEDILRQLFEATGGTVVEVSLPKDRATGRPRGFGFVTLSSSAEAQAARESLDGSMQAGKSISVRPFQAEPPKREGGMGGPRSERGGGPAAADRTIYVGNLPYDASQAEVEALFSNANAGPVVRVSLPTDEEGRKRGFGFVTMASAETANAAIEALRGADLRGRSLIVNLARPKGEGGGGGGGSGYGGPSSHPYGGGGGGGGFSGSPPFRSGPAPEGSAGGGGGGPASRGRKQYDKRRNAEGEGPRKKAWDRERGGGGRVDPNDWGDD
ncbi:MAG TPA: hypothetical protein VFS43_42665 [Polyangiaceae bacterium]|nr:hypothetical protein [Polyangiaceae bacterium]